MKSKEFKDLQLDQLALVSYLDFKFGENDQAFNSNNIPEQCTIENYKEEFSFIVYFKNNGKVSFLPQGKNPKLAEKTIREVIRVIQNQQAKVIKMQDDTPFDSDEMKDYIKSVKQILNDKNKLH